MIMDIRFQVTICKLTHDERKLFMSEKPYTLNILNNAFNVAQCSEKGCTTFTSSDYYFAENWAHRVLVFTQKFNDFGTIFVPSPLIFYNFRTISEIVLWFRHYFHILSLLFLSNSSGREQQENINSRALRPGGPPPKRVSAIDQSHISLPTSIIPGTMSGLRAALLDEIS